MEGVGDRPSIKYSVVMTHVMMNASHGSSISANAAAYASGAYMPDMRSR